MNRTPRKPHDDQDGVRVFEIGSRGGPRLGVLAVGTIAAIAALYLFLGPGKQAAPDVSIPPVDETVARLPAVPAPARSLHKPPAAHVAEGAKTTRRASIPDRPEDRARSNPDAQGVPDPAPNAEATGDEPAQLESFARDLIQKLRAAGETGGIAVFPPPGTNPVKTGIIVPETFELPEGYVRYYQVTDDGRRLEPILMFSPDYEFLGDDGEPIALPEDGIVPPDMAPSGLPVRMLEIPNADAGSR